MPLRERSGQGFLGRTCSRPLRQDFAVGRLEDEAFEPGFTRTGAGVLAQGVQGFGLFDAQAVDMPFAVVLHVEACVAALGQECLGVGGPVKFAASRGAALQFKLEQIGAG
ncbi:MAG: hypothetical protein CJBNEKGG_01059 [Prosthecobacter sp.]|nr:hypothetical protein [Prosthecobacter sp.]